ncbi:hypothetical protein A0R60_1135 [Enterobacter asburiae]|nr:hypothetical protein A0R60_1135 [Enterobacter asburiae]
MKVTPGFLQAHYFYSGNCRRRARRSRRHCTTSFVRWLSQGHLCRSSPQNCNSCEYTIAAIVGRRLTKCKNNCCTLCAI